MPCITCPDNDGDGFTAKRCGGTDCDDADEHVNPRAREFCGDEIDNDCDLKKDCEDENCQTVCTDYDDDGYNQLDGDCDESNPNIHPNADETCGDNVDSDCDGNDPPCPPCEIGGCPSGCAWHCQLGYCVQIAGGGPCQSSPVLVDVAGDGFRLTGAAGGVNFDLNHDGVKERLAWTSAGSDDAWLALDSDGNGEIDDGAEMFGTYSPQPEPPAGRERNGFTALAEFDKPAPGGNDDGLIDARDAAFSSLRLWRDANHDGVSQRGELYALPALGVEAVSLDYVAAGRRDRHGNEFRYRAKVYGTGRGGAGGRWAYDVFLRAAA
jgi:hypothetical protein